jgi:hypothetical protein
LRCWSGVIRQQATIRRGWATCQLRELGTRWPRLAMIARRVLFGLARPSNLRSAPERGPIRYDGPAVGPPPSSMVHPSKRGDEDRGTTPRGSVRTATVKEFHAGLRARGFEGSPA